MLHQKYLELVNDLFAEPKNEEIVGSFMIPCTKSELQGEIELEEDSIIVIN